MLRLLFTATSLLALTACAVEPPPRPYRERMAAAAPEPVRVNTDVYAYPLQGQAPERVDRDRYECYGWAVKQTGFDPSAPGSVPHQRVRVVQGPSSPPGSTTAAGAVTGGALGAIVAGPHSTAEGAVLGAIAGAVVGTAAEQQQNQRIENAQRAVDERRAEQNAQANEQAANYRRALGACLEGRGYSVR